MDWPLALLITLLIIATIAGGYVGTQMWEFDRTWRRNMGAIFGSILISWLIASLIWGVIGIIAWVWSLT